MASVRRGLANTERGLNVSDALAKDFSALSAGSISPEEARNVLASAGPKSGQAVSKSIDQTMASDVIRSKNPRDQQNIRDVFEAGMRGSAESGLAAASEIASDPTGRTIQAAQSESIKFQGDKAAIQQTTTGAAPDSTASADGVFRKGALTPEQAVDGQTTTSNLNPISDLSSSEPAIDKKQVTKDTAPATGTTPTADAAPVDGAAPASDTTPTADAGSDAGKTNHEMVTDETKEVMSALVDSVYHDPEGQASIKTTIGCTKSEFG